MKRFNIIASFPIVWVLDFIQTVLIPAVWTEYGDNDVKLSRSAIDKTLKSMRVSRVKFWMCVCVFVYAMGLHS